jgi:hypothetical protein
MIVGSHEYALLKCESRDGEQCADCGQAESEHESEMFQEPLRKCQSPYLQVNYGNVPIHLRDRALIEVALAEKVGAKYKVAFRE